MRKLLVIGVGIVGSFAALAEGPLPNAPHIYVEGSASLEVVPDSLTLSVSYQAVAPTAEAAKSQIDDRTRKLLAAFKKLGIPERDYSSSAPYVSPATEYADGRERVIGTRASRNVEVTLKKLAGYGDFIAAIMASDPTSVGGMQAHIQNEKEVLARAQVDALADARSRAEKLAAASNAKLGAVYSISEFALRQDESWRLDPNRVVTTKSTGAALLASEGSMNRQPEPFVPGTLWATARVFVVFLIEPQR